MSSPLLPTKNWFSERLRESDEQAQGHAAESVLSDYFAERYAHTRGGEFLWLCLSKGGKHFAYDIPINFNDDDFGLGSLRRQSGWWKRFSLYSATAVELIELRVVHVEQSCPDSKVTIRVCVRPYDPTGDLMRLSAWESSPRDPVFVPGRGEDCYLAMNGEEVHNKLCDRNLYTTNNESRLRCRLPHFADKRKVEWIYPLMGYFWQHGMDARGLLYLSNVGFTHGYHDRWLTFQDAADPFGKTYKGFLLVEGWHVRYLLVVIAAGLVACVCIVAFTAVFTQNMEIALAAGSYACGIGGAMLALFSFLSAVLHA